eukprot:jgi/Chrzof1/4961/Cz15g06130.t1
MEASTAQGIPAYVTWSPLWVSFMILGPWYWEYTFRKCLGGKPANLPYPSRPNRPTWHTLSTAAGIAVISGAQAACCIYMLFKLGHYKGLVNPAWWMMVPEALVWAFISDVLTYFYHKACHDNKWLYNNMHYLHHEYMSPNGGSALMYVHPVDIFLSNVLTLAPMLMYPTYGVTVVIFGLYSLITTTAGHTGLEFENKFLQWLFDPQYHLEHHRLLRCNYAEHFTIMDRLMGTYYKHGVTPITNLLPKVGNKQTAATAAEKVVRAAQQDDNEESEWTLEAAYHDASEVISG